MLPMTPAWSAPDEYTCVAAIKFDAGETTTAGCSAEEPKTTSGVPPAMPPGMDDIDEFVSRAVLVHCVLAPGQAMLPAQVK